MYRISQRKIATEAQTEAAAVRMGGEGINTAEMIIVPVGITHLVVTITTRETTVLAGETVATATLVVAAEDGPDRPRTPAVIVIPIGDEARAHMVDLVMNQSLISHEDTAPMCQMCKLSCSPMSIAIS